MPKRILIIDDEPDIRLYLCAALEDAGYAPRAMGPDEELSALLEAFAPDAVVLDIMMPVRSGVSLYREIRRSPQWSRIPVVIISGMSPRAELADSGFARLVGDDSIPPPEAILEKPLSLDALFGVLESLVSRAEV